MLGRDKYTMIRLLSIFRNIKDVKKVLNFYTEEIFPILHQLPGVIGTDLHSVSEVSQEFPQELDGVQLIFETYFETYEIFAEMLVSSEGIEIMNLMEKNKIGDYYIYWTKVKRFRGEFYSSKVSSSAINAVDVYQVLESVEKIATSKLKGLEQSGALQAIHEIRTELNFIELKT